jgi:hypothetical protein
LVRKKARRAVNPKVEAWAQTLEQIMSAAAEPLLRERGYQASPHDPAGARQARPADPAG